VFLNSFFFSLSVTAPIFVVLIMGIYLKRINFINDEFIHISSKVVFNISLPILLFLTIVKIPLTEVDNFPLIVYALISTLVVYLALEWWAKRLEPKEDRGVFVQGAFRGNLGFIGLAYCVNAYGEEGLVAASLYIGFATTLYNILSVVTLNKAMGRSINVLNVTKSIITNPLIIGILTAVLFSTFKIPVPEFAERAGGYLANLTLPLALLCTGGSLNFQELKTNPRKTFYSSLAKLVLVPFVVTFGAYFIGFRGIDLGVLFLMSSAPTATASFIMVKGLGGNYQLSANIVALTTLGALVSVSIGLLILRSLNLM